METKIFSKEGLDRQITKSLHADNRHRRLRAAGQFKLPRRKLVHRNNRQFWSLSVATQQQAGCRRGRKRRLLKARQSVPGTQKEK
jgi:hypothetical protein